MKFTTVAVGVASAFSTFVAAGENFYQSCEPDWYVEMVPIGNPNDRRYTPWMHGECNNRYGQVIRSRLDLNQCIGNNDGTMIPQIDGGFGLSCSDCQPTIDQPRADDDFQLPPGITIPGLWENSDILKCNCGKRGEGRNLGVEIHLNSLVGNENGILHCGGGDTFRAGVRE